jgi:hypothetical protein
MIRGITKLVKALASCEGVWVSRKLRGNTKEASSREHFAYNRVYLFVLDSNLFQCTYLQRNKEGKKS